MKTGLVVFGAILLALGAIMYFLNAQPITGQVVGEGVNSQVTSRFSLPWQIPALLSLLGVVLMISGMIAPDYSVRRHTDIDGRRVGADRVEVYEKRERHLR